ncbi:MAG: hypothetical protein ACE5GM_00600 [bacterium]
MSNKLRRKGDKSPSVRVTEFNNRLREVDQKFYQLYMLLQEADQSAKFASSQVYDFMQFCFQKGLVVEEEYKDFVKEQNEKRKTAGEIAKDGQLSDEEKIKKAEEKGIPSEWVVTPKPEDQAEEGEVAEDKGEEPAEETPEKTDSEK